MAFIVEDGTGLSNANSYASVGDADTYHSDRGNVNWTLLTTAEKQARLIKATTYLDGKYSWPGEVVNGVQALQWPREGATNSMGYDLVGVPGSVVKATCEAALIETLSTTLTRGGAVASETVGQISVSYFNGAKGGNDYPQIDEILRFVTYPGQVKVSL